MPPLYLHWTIRKKKKKIPSRRAQNLLDVFARQDTRLKVSLKPQLDIFQSFRLQQSTREAFQIPIPWFRSVRISNIRDQQTRILPVIGWLSPQHYALHASDQNKSLPPTPSKEFSFLSKSFPNFNHLPIQHQGKHQTPSLPRNQRDTAAQSLSSRFSPASKERTVASPPREPRVKSRGSLARKGRRGNGKEGKRGIKLHLPRSWRALVAYRAHHHPFCSLVSRAGDPWRPDLIKSSRGKILSLTDSRSTTCSHSLHSYVARERKNGFVWTDREEGRRLPDSFRIHAASPRVTGGSRRRGSSYLSDLIETDWNRFVW